MLAYLLNFSTDNIIFLEEASHHKFILFGFPSLDGQINRGEVKNSVLVRIDVDCPPFAFHIHDSSDDYVP